MIYSSSDRTKRWMFPLIPAGALSVLFGVTVLSLAGCEGDAENAAEDVGESIDDAGDEIEDAVDDLD